MMRVLNNATNGLINSTNSKPKKILIPSRWHCLVAARSLRHSGPNMREEWLRCVWVLIIIFNSSRVTSTLKYPNRQRIDSDDYATCYLL
jgi:hypothetical protein